MSVRFWGSGQAVQRVLREGKVQDIWRRFGVEEMVEGSQCDLESHSQHPSKLLKLSFAGWPAG